METLPSSISRSLSPWDPGIFSLSVFALFILILVGVILFLIFWLNPGKPQKVKLDAYECGIIPTGSARFRYPTPFYLVAIFFLIFDVEVVYIISWAISFDNLSLAYWLYITYFILVLLVSLFYLWRKGALEWGVLLKP